jgi:hypothetical protein
VRCYIVEIVCFTTSVNAKHDVTARFLHHLHSLYFPYSMKDQVNVFFFALKHYYAARHTYVLVNKTLFVCTFCFESHEQFFSYLAIVTITGDRAANIDLCLALTAFSSKDSFTCHTYCVTIPLFLRSYPKDPWFSLLNAVLLAKEQLLPILNVLGFDAAGTSGAWTHDLPDAKREHYHLATATGNNSTCASTTACRTFIILFVST